VLLTQLAFFTSLLQGLPALRAVLNPTPHPTLHCMDPGTQVGAECSSDQLGPETDLVWAFRLLEKQQISYSLKRPHLRIQCFLLGKSQELCPRWAYSQSWQVQLPYKAGPWLRHWWRLSFPASHHLFCLGSRGSDLRVHSNTIGSAGG
jgi:hypothetical protein